MLRPAIVGALLLACAACSIDARTSAGADAASLVDSGLQPGLDAAVEPGEDATYPGIDSGPHPGRDASQNPGLDASQPQPGRDAGPRVDAGPQATLPGKVSGDFRVNNFGWRTGDTKIAVLLGHAGASVDLRNTQSGSTAATYTASAAKTESSYSGDSYATVDFTAFTTPGDYFLYIASADIRSYSFRIADDVYDIVGAAAVKAYYYQRCNHDKATPYATDGLGGFDGHGGQWVDGACHASDSALPAGPGSPDNGTLDLHGGWHDAGDYQKTLWGRGVSEMLFAYEMNPGAWKDGQLNIPESGNGIPDLLDEVKWELDFYLRMQRPDGHFMTSAKGHSAKTTSPPSASDELRVYFDCTSPNSSEWSGGGVTLAEATGNAVLSLAHAAIVFRAIGQTTTGDGYAAAAAKGWTWLNGQNLTNDGERRLRAAASSAVFRMDPTNASAKAVADAFAWDTFDGTAATSSMTGEAPMSTGAWHYLLNSSGTASVKAKAKTGVQKALVDPAFTIDGVYGGMFGDSSNGWDWSWGSNRNQGAYGFNLMMAAKQGITGSHTAQEVSFLAQKHLHFLCGLNPLNMVYLTNMAAYGGEHSSFQLYHGWFSHNGADEKGNPQYNGRPTWVDEPLYPYYPDDSQTSTFGPAPGLIPGGPNWYYGKYSGADYTIPNRKWPAYAYREFSIGCDWDDQAQICKAASWEITEPMQAYQGPFVGLVSFLMSSQ
jgi:hypothetical protein